MLFTAQQGENKVQLAGIWPQNHREAVLQASNNCGTPSQCGELHEGPQGAGSLAREQ